jgi:DNA-binding transcriptional regulator YiaG
MTHLEILNLWKSPGELAADLGDTKDTVRKWWERKRIPPHHWAAVAEAAAKRGLGVTLKAIAEQGARQ